MKTSHYSLRLPDLPGLVPVKTVGFRLDCCKTLSICLLNHSSASFSPSAPAHYCKCRGNPPPFRAAKIWGNSCFKLLNLTTNHVRILTTDYPPIPSRKEKTVFISGSAYEYGSLGDDGAALIRNLTRSLLRRCVNILTGFGLGVGNHRVESALDEIYAQPGNRLTTQLRVFPFPTSNGSVHHPDLENLYRSYRNDMIAQAGSAIFLFGNKLEDIAVREADGMRKEYEIARSQGIRVIPVGVSGYISAAIWKDVVDHFDDYFADRSNFDSFLCLGNAESGQQAWIDAVLQIANAAHEKKESIHLS